MTTVDLGECGADFTANPYPLLPGLLMRGVRRLPVSW
jgi:hypothetical protein